MRHLRSAKPLPRYVRRKPLAGGKMGIFLRAAYLGAARGLPGSCGALGEDYGGAVLRAEDVLLKVFDSWRTAGLSDMVPIGPAVGSFDWLATIFKSHHAWAGIDRKTRRLYEQGLSLFAEHA